MLFLEALRIQTETYTKIAYRKQGTGLGERLLLIIYYSPQCTYTLKRMPSTTSTDSWTFRYLTDLFAFAKQEGFFEEVNPHLSDWVAGLYPVVAVGREETRDCEPEEPEEYEDEFTYLEINRNPYSDRDDGEIEVALELGQDGEWHFYDNPSYWHAEYDENY